MVNTKIRLIMFFAAEDAEAQYSQQKYDLEFTVAQSMNSLLQILKKVGKTSKPFWYDLNKVPFNYTVEVTNKLKGLDLIECLKNNGQRFVTLYRRQWPKSFKEKEMQEGKMIVWGGLTNSWENKRSERQRRKGTECRVLKNSKER